MAFGIAFALSFAGCGKNQPAVTNSTDGAVASAGDSSGFLLPPDFKVVDIPLDKRKEVFKEAHNIRTLAVQEANLEIPMDEASLPHLNTKAFDKRVADHMAIINRILAKNLPVLAEKYKISVADVEKIEDEANRLRWLPPQDPVFEAKPGESHSKTKREENSQAEKKDGSPPKTSETK